MATLDDYTEGHLPAERREVTANVVVSADLPRLFDEHYRSLVRMASIYVDDRETAEEVVQDAFVKLVGGSYRVEPGKEAPYLRYYLDLSEAEIAETLGIAPGSVKSHAHRALAKLKRQLENER